MPEEVVEDERLIDLVKMDQKKDNNRHGNDRDRNWPFLFVDLFPFDHCAPLK
jgi:hypothetical protein